MNEEALRVLYGLAQGDGYKKSFNEFKTLMSQNSDAVSTMYSLAQGDGYKKSRDEFNTLVGFGGGQTTVTETVTETVVEEPKKKGFLETMQDRATAAASPSTSEEQPSSSDLQEETPEAGTQRTLNGKPLIVAYNAQGEAVYLDFSGAIVGKVGDPVLENQLAEEERLVYERTGEAPKKVEGGLEYTTEEGETVVAPEPEPLEDRLAREEYIENLRRLAGAPQQEEFIETQGPMAGLPVTQPLEARGFDVAQDITQPAFPTVSKASQKTMGENLWEGIKYYTGMDVNERGRDPFSAGILYVGDELFELWGDAARSVYAGFDQGAAVSPSLGLMRNGRDATDEEIDRFVTAYNRMASTPPSDEMESFMQIYEDGGKTLASWFNGVKANPTVLPQLFISSTAAMANSQSTILAAILGAPIAAVNPRAGLSVTMGLASGSLDGALTFGELLQEEIGEGIPLTNQNVRAVLEDDEAYNRIWNEALRRGLTIGLIDAATGFGTVGVTKRVLKGTTKTLGRTGGKALASTAGGTVEVAGGVSSEVLGRVAAGQEQDIAEAAFEGLVGKSVDAPLAISYGIYEGSQPEYKMNGGVASRADVINFLETSTDEQFAAVPIQIINDEGLLALATDRKNKIKNIKAAQEELVAAGVTDPKKVSELSKLESEKQQLEGNSTEAGKRRLQEINDQINSILDEPTEVTTETEAVRIYEGKDRNGNTKQVKLTTQENGRIRLDIVNDDGSTALIGDFPAESTDTDIVSNIIDIEQDFNIVKPQDAIQESSTETVDVQEPTRDSEAVGERDATGAVTTEGEAEVQVEETPLTVREEAADLAAMVGEELQAPAPTTEAAPVAEEAEVETYTLPETIKERKQDFEIIDNRGGKAELEIFENGNGRWWVANKKTGKLLALKTKADAQAEVKDPETEWYGEGAPIITEETTTEAAPAVTEETTVTEEMPTPGTVEIYEGIDPYSKKTERVGVVYTDDGGVLSYRIKPDGKIPSWTKRGISPAESKKRRAEMGYRDMVDDHISEFFSGGRDFRVVSTEAPSTEAPVTVPTVSEQMPAPGTVEIYEGIRPSGSKKRIEVIYTDDGGVAVFGIGADGKRTGNRSAIPPGLSFARRTDMGYRDMVDDHISSTYFNKGRDFRVVSTEAPSTEAPTTYDFESVFQAEKATTEAAPVAEAAAPAVTETPTEAAPAAELTEEQREFITEDDAGINGLAYTPNYIETVWDNIIDVLGDKSFTSLFKKHINEDFTSSMIEEELGEFSSTMIDLDDGMQKFIDLVNDANKRIKRKGGNQINLMPLERTAPSSETLIEVGMTDENTEADFKRFEQEYKDRNPFQVDPFNDDLTDKRKQARDDKAKQYAKEQVKKMLQESEAPTKPKPTATESRPLKEEIKNRVEKIPAVFPWFNSIVKRDAGIDTDAEIKEYYIQSIENGGTIGKLNEDFYKREFKRLGIDPKLYVEDLSDLFRPLQVHRKAKDVDLNDYKLFRLIDRGRNYGKLFRKIKPAPKEGVSLYVEEGSKVYFDDSGVLRPEGGAFGKMAGIYMGDIMLEPVSPAPKAKPAPAPKAKPAPAPKAKPAPAPKVEPVAKGVDPFYESVEAQQKQEERIGKLADRARTAIKKVLPDAKIILHRTEAEYNKATKANSKGSQGGAGSRGVLIGDTIHVNMPHANDRTIAHEVFHALLTNLSKENSVDVINLTKKMAESLKGKIKDKEILAELDKFVDQYSGQVESAQAEEMVAEFMGILAERYNSLDKPAKSLVQRFLERLADLLGLSKTFVPKARTRKGQLNTVNLLETLAGKVATGQQIFEEDIMLLIPYKDGQPDFQAEPDNLTVQEIDAMAMEEVAEYERKVQEKMLSPIEQILYREGVQVTREEYIANRGEPDAPGRNYRGLFHKGKPEVDAKAKELTDRLENDDGTGIVITEEDIFDYIDARADTKGKFTQKNLKFLRDNGLLDYDQRFDKSAFEMAVLADKFIRDVKRQETAERLRREEAEKRLDKAPKSPKQQMAELAKDYGIEESGFLSFQINDGILRPKLRKLGYELRRHSTGFTIRDANDRMYRPPTGRGAGRKFQLFGGKDANIAEIVNIARESNINRQATKEFLMSNRGLTAKQADKLLDVSTDNMYTVPVSFGNIGLRDGIVLFEKVANYADKIAKDKKVKVMDRLPMTLEFLKKQPEYIAQADKKTKGPSTIQMQMQSDVQKALGLKKTADMSKRLKALNEKVRQRKKGARDLKATQRELRNFIRQALPADLYSKSDVVRMMGKITSLRSTEESNMQKLTNEVVEFVTEKQVNFLEKTIDSILNGKYETVQSGRKKGRKIDSATRQRFEDIKKNIVGENVPAEDVVKENETLNNEYSALEGKVDRTIQDDERMLDLAAAMAINHSKLMDNTDVNKVESLQRAEDILSGILGEGKQAFKARLQADHERYKQLISDVYKDITGLDIDPNNPKMMSKLKKDQDKIDRRQKSKIENASKRSIRILNDALKTYIRANYDLNQLMKVIMEAPGAAIQGKTEAIVLDAINEATRTFKEAKLNDKDQISSKLQEIFGKKWEKAVAAGVPRRFTGVYINKQKVADAKAAYDKNPTKENKERYEAIEAVNNIELSPNEIADLYFQYQDKANIPSFENPENENFGPDHERIMNELVATIDKRHIEFGEWMVNEFLPTKYEFYNPSYEQVYRTNMPWNQNYAGRIYRVGGGEPKTLNLLGKDAVENKVVGAASSKIRRQNNKPIEPQDMYSNLMTYLEEMNWMAAHAPTLRDMDKIFSSPAIRDAISNLDGKNLNELIKIQLERIAARGINPAKGEKFVKFANDLFVTTRLGGYKPSIMLKQLTSFLTYGNEIGYVTYTKYSAMSTGEFKSTWKEVMDNSVYVRDRVSSDFKRLVANYSNERALDVMPTLSKDRWQNVMFFFSRVGDIGAIFIGGVPNYRYYKADFKSKNPNATEQEVIDYAIRKFEKDTKTTQQSSDIQDKDYFQTGGAIARGINMFLTTSKQYLRREFEGVRQMRRAVRDSEKFEKTKLPAIVKGPAKTLDSMFTDKEFQKGFRTFITFQAVLPAFFQWVALGFPGIAKDFDDEDKKDMLRSVILGPFNGLFLIGDILTGIADNIQDKPYAGGISFLPMAQQFNDISETYKWWSQSKDGSEKKEKWRNKLFWQIGELVGGGLSQAGGLPIIPIRNLKQLYDNLYKAAEAKDAGELVLRMLNYSDYRIEGSKEEERGSERRTTPVSGSSRGGSSGDRPSSRRSSGRRSSGRRSSGR